MTDPQRAASESPSPKVPSTSVDAEVAQPAAERSIYAAAPKEWSSVGPGMWGLAVASALSLAVVLIGLMHAPYLSLIFADEPDLERLQAEVPALSIYIAGGLALAATLIGFLGLIACTSAPVPQVARRFSLAALLFVLGTVAMIFAGVSVNPDELGFLWIAIAVSLVARVAWQMAYLNGVGKLVANRAGLNKQALRTCGNIRFISGLGFVLGLLSLAMFAVAVSLMTFKNHRLEVVIIDGRAGACLWIGLACLMGVELLMFLVNMMLAPFVLRQRHLDPPPPEPPPEKVKIPRLRAKPPSA